MAINKLSAKAVEAAAPGSTLRDGGGLELRVSAAGSAAWVLRFQIAGRRREMGLGSPGLAEARKIAVACRAQIATGFDPIEAREGKRAEARLASATAISFQQCAEAYIAAHRAGWRNAKHGAQWGSTLNAYAYPIFGGLPVQAVDVGLVMKAVEPIWSVKPETASRVRGRIESVLDWATARGYRQGENPARWRGHIENLLPKRSKVARVEHHAALSYPEIADFMTALRAREGSAALALQFVVLTAARTGEALGARWSEVDFATRTWSIPATRMKGSREHRVPLSDAAVAILRVLAETRKGDFVFPGARQSRPLSQMSMAMTLRRMSRLDITVHGFRSTFRDWASETTSYSREVVEMSLAHAIGDKVEAAYRRGDLFEKRRQLMSAWSRYIDTHPAAATSNIVNIGR